MVVVVFFVFFMWLFIVCDCKALWATCCIKLYYIRRNKERKKGIFSWRGPRVGLKFTKRHGGPNKTKISYCWSAKKTNLMRHHGYQPQDLNLRSYLAGSGVLNWNFAGQMLSRSRLGHPWCIRINIINFPFFYVETCLELTRDDAHTFVLKRT